jgi:mxaA protein
MSTIMRWAVVGLAVFTNVATADAQVRSVKLFTSRAFGYFVGDIVRSEVDVVVDKDVSLLPASVPQPGRLNSWLELIASRVEESSTKDTRFYRLYFDYQNFYPALDSRALEIPGFTLSFISGGRTVSAQVPAWSFLISSLREVLPAPKASGADYMQPDASPRGTDLRRDRSATFGFLAACLVALGFLAHHLAWWPFGAGPKRPFTAAAKRVHMLFNTSEDEVSYREALLILHRAVDATAGHAVFAEDMPDFLERTPAFSPLEDQFSAFFRSSRRTFFADDFVAATADFSPRELSHLCERLAAIERAAR